MTPGTAQQAALAPSRRIFISYRREDTAGYAHLLFYQLNARFPKRIFMDLSSIQLGADFVAVIDNAVSSCDVLIALIDKNWISKTDANGRRRLDDPRDFVRLEIATALKRKICVIPALLNGAAMPGAKELPKDLALLARRQALMITDSDLDHNLAQLIQAIEQELAERGEPEPPPDSPVSVSPPDAFSALLGQARQAIAVEDWRAARERLEAALSLKPDHPEAAAQLHAIRHQQRLADLFAQGEAHYEAGRKREALACFQEVRLVGANYKDVDSRIMKTKREVSGSSFWLALATLPGKPTPKQQLAMAIAAVGLSVIAQLLGSTQKITRAFVHVFGFRVVGSLAIAVFVITVVAYALGYSSLYRQIAPNRPNLHRYWLTSIALVAFAATLIANLLLIPPRPDPVPILTNEIPRWIDRIFENQEARDFGLRVEIARPELKTQVFLTAQGLKAVLASRRALAHHATPIRSAFDYIETSRRTRPMEGWGYWSASQQTLTEIGAWAALAYIESLQPGVLGAASEQRLWNDQQTGEIVARVERELEQIAARQDATGGWGPIGEVRPSFTRTYSTIMALWSLIEADDVPVLGQRLGNRHHARIQNGIQWLLNRYDRQLGWVPNPNRVNQREQFPGLTAQVLFVLSRAEAQYPVVRNHSAYKEAKIRFLADNELVKQPLSSNTRLPDTDQHFDTADGFTAEGMTFLWFPWAAAVYGRLSNDPALSQKERHIAAARLFSLYSRFDDLFHLLETGPTYVLAENLLCVSYGLAASQSGVSR